MNLYDPWQAKSVYRQSSIKSLTYVRPKDVHSSISQIE